MTKPVLETLESRVLLSSALAPTLNAVDVKWHGQTVQAVQNEYVLQTRSGKTLESLVKRLGLKATDIEDLGGGGFYKFKSTDAVKNIEKWSVWYSKSVEAVAPNTVVHVNDTIPDDPRYAAEQWGLNNSGQDISGGAIPQVGTVGADIDAQKAWDITTGDTSLDPKQQVIIAVIDTGIDLNHPDLVTNIFHNPDETAGDGIDNDGNGYIDDVTGWDAFDDDATPSDGDGHGTHVSGIIGATGNNTIGVTGVNWHVKILPVRVLGDDGFSTADSVVKGMRYISRLKEEGFNIVAANASLGGTRFPFDEIESRAAEQMGERGVLLVVAAGNDSLNNDRFTDFPAKYSLNLPNVITVAATTNQDQLAFFSNFGAASVQVAAPGQDILSTTPTYPVTLTESAGFDPFTGLPLPPETTNTYGYLSGTSMASPMVAGIIGLEKAAKPNATMIELKNALINSTDAIQSLGSVNHLPAKVTTGGRVNAFRALKYILNEPVGNDAVTSGNWHGVYGSDGAYVVGESSAFPDFVDGRVIGDSTQVNPPVPASRTSNLQTIADPNNRVAAYFASPTSMTIDLNFTDGETHRVGLYMSDVDRKRRTQVVNLLDADSGIVTDSQTVSKFNNGKYLFWDVKGHVQIQLIRQKGPNAVFSGVFFDTPPTDAGLLVSTDTSTRGNWTQKYGSQGAVVVGDTTTPPDFVSITPTGKTDVISRARTSNASALQRPSDLAHRLIAAWTSTTTFDVDLDFNDGETHRTTFYFLDNGNKSRHTRVELLDSTGTEVLSRTDLMTYSKGQYLTFDLSDDVKLRVTNLSGPDAGLNGIFFDATPAAQVQFVGVDTTTRGNWRNARYGTLGHLIAGIDTLASFDEQLIASITDLAGGLSTVVQSQHSSNRSAMQQPADPTDRINARFENPSTILIDILFNDSRTHRLAMYAHDPGSGRDETVEVLDGTSGDTLSTTRLTSFKSGKMIVWQVRSHIRIRITSNVAQSALFDGLLFD